MIFAENSQIFLKISVIPILLTIVYLVALDLLVTFNTTHGPTQLIIVAHNCLICFYIMHSKWNLRIRFLVQKILF